MDSVIKSPWEINDIEYEIDDENQFIENFIIYEDFEIIPKSSNFKIGQSNNFIDTFENSESKTGIMISGMPIHNKFIYILILDKTIFIINQVNLHKFVKYFKEHSKNLIFSTPQIKEYIEKIISNSIQISEGTDHLFNEHQKFTSIKEEIFRCIIKKSQYRSLKLHHELLPRDYNFNNEYEYQNFIRLRYIKSDSQIELCYNSKEQILNILKPDSEHENEFYQQIENTFPFICKIFGKTRINDHFQKIVIEYIEGERLDDFIINHKKIDYTTKMKIIVEILLAVFYAHSNGFYLRDLKPDNIMIDSESNAFLIDFNYSKKIDSPNEKENTGNIGNSFFVAPEQLNTNDYSYKVDIYSVGIILHFIITEKKIDFSFDDLSRIYENKENISENKKFPKCQKEFEHIFNIYRKCFEISPDSRPTLSTLIYEIIFGDNEFNNRYIPIVINHLEKYESILKVNDDFESTSLFDKYYLHFILGKIYDSDLFDLNNVDKAIFHYKISVNSNYSDAQYWLGLIYYIQKDAQQYINESIHYLTLAANQNHKYAQFFLSEIYYKAEYVPRNINKSIHYLTLSANQNHFSAQYYLGEIYYAGKHVPRDINKSIHYFTLSSNLNNSNSQYYLGEIYYTGQFVPRDINKSIHYFTLSSNLNNSNAQYYLGTIYYVGEYITQDINKSIHYFTLSANYNNSNAQCILGFIYYTGEYVPRDINKSIHYFTLSADQNNSNAQFFLGQIYYEGKYVPRDINKSIHYFTLSAKQNDSHAQYYLGQIYYEGKYIEKDIKESINYLKKSSSFYNSIAKNLLGVIYKNGDGVERNICYSMVYFEEAINEQKNPYSMYNLARIYFFGIDVDRKIEESIRLLEDASEKQLYLADLFLFFIFTYCDDTKFLNRTKSSYYGRKSFPYEIFIYQHILFHPRFGLIQKLNQFFKEYDLLHCYDYGHDLFYFIKFGKFYDWRYKINEKTNTNKDTLRKDIDDDFYKGFYGEIE